MISSGCWLVFNQALGGLRHNQRLKLYLLVPKDAPTHASTQGASISYTLKKLFFSSVKSSLQKPPPRPPPRIS